MHLKARQSGFTLVELLITVFIAAILGWAVVTMIPAKQPTAVKGVTADLAGSLLAAQTLARNSGRKVFLQTSGGGAATPVLQWGFDDDPAKAVVGTWSEEPSAFSVASVGIGNTDFSNAGPNPDPRTSVPAIQGYVSVASWGTSFFDGSGAFTVKAYIDSTGAVSSDLFVSVCGRGQGKVYQGCPMGLVVFGAKTGIGSFYKPKANDASQPWQRL